MLFIIVHQVSELWMRLMLHELTRRWSACRRDDLDPALKMLAPHFAHPDAADLGLDVHERYEQRFVLPADFANALGQIPRVSQSPCSTACWRISCSGNKKRRDGRRYNQRERARKHKKTLHTRNYRPRTSLYEPRCCGCDPHGVTDSAGNYLSRDFSDALPASKQGAGAWLGVYHNRLEIRAGPVRAAERPWWTLDHNFQFCGAAINLKTGRAHHRLQPHRRHRRAFPISAKGAGAQVLSGCCGRSGPRCISLLSRPTNNRLICRRRNNTEGDLPTAPEALESA